MTAEEGASYSLREVQSLLGLSRPVIEALVAAGFVTPQRGPRREARFSFQDMVLLRTAEGLQAAEIPPRRIARSLKKLREALPPSLPLAGLRIAALGNDVVVREGGRPWQADSGQMLFDFEVAPAPSGRAASAAVDALPEAARSPRSNVLHLMPTRPRAEPPQDWFQRGVELEARDAKSAEAAYRRAIAADPSRADAYLNLGVLLGRAGRHADAARVYRRGLERCPREPLLHYNLAVALEDAGEPDAALAAYGQCLALDPAMADAHFNAARLFDQHGMARQAIRHYSAYRRLRK